MNRDVFERQWLAGLPEDWEEKRADFLCNAGRTTVDPGVYDDDLVTHYSIPQVQATGGPAIEPASDIDSSKLLITAPTLLVSKLNPRKSTVCIAIPAAERPTLASGEFVAIRSNKIDQKYAYYLWSSAKVTDRLSAIVHSVTRSHQRVNPADITKLPWKWPPLETQRRIARFLDAKTARIDSLIAKKRALLKRLAEKRQALITQAVTQGLDPTVPMKDSGIDWLGQIPTHWDVTPLYARYNVALGKMLDERSITGDWLLPYLRNVDIQWGKVNLLDLPQMDIRPSERARYTVCEGDLLVCEGGEVGRAAIAGEDAAGVAYQKALHRLRPTKKTESTRFMFYVLRCAAGLGVFVSNGNTNTIIHLTAEKLRQHRFAFPPDDEQRAIAEFLDAVVDRVDLATSRIDESINKLTEYRSALITAAVTGQLDIPAALPDDQAEAPLDTLATEEA